MIIDFSKKGKVMITMKDYIEEMLLELPDDMSGTSCTPASNHFFEIDEKAQKLSQ